MEVLNENDAPSLNNIAEIPLVVKEEELYTFIFTRDDDDLRVSKDSTEHIVLSIDSTPRWLTFSYDATPKIATQVLQGVALCQPL